MSREDRLTTHKQRSPHVSARPLSLRLMQLLWEWVWSICCLWTPKPLNGWRLFWLRVFGCQIDGEPFVHQRARIEVRWNLILHDRAVIGDRTHVYNLGEVEIGARAILAQESYMCSATHDFADPNLALQTAKILIGEDAFIGARAFVLPGVHIGAGAIIGAC